MQPGKPRHQQPAEFAQALGVLLNLPGDSASPASWRAMAKSWLLVPGFPWGRTEMQVSPADVGGAEPRSQCLPLALDDGPQSSSPCALRVGVQR